MLTEISPSLSVLALAARLNKLKILLKGDRSSQNTINNFKMPFQDQQDNLEHAGLVYPKRSQSLKTHSTQKREFLSGHGEEHQLCSSGGMGAGKSQDWGAEGAFILQVVHK